jgi:single-stranded DNA-binding protein
MPGQAEAQIYGYLATDPNLIDTGRDKVCRMRIIVERSYPTRSFKEYFIVVSFGAKAEYHKEQLSKGDQVMVSGQLRSIRRQVGTVIFEEVQIHARDISFTTKNRRKEDMKELARLVMEELEENHTLEQDEDDRRTECSEKEDFDL